MRKEHSILVKKIIRPEGERRKEQRRTRKTNR